MWLSEAPGRPGMTRDPPPPILKAILEFIGGNSPDYSKGRRGILILIPVTPRYEAVIVSGEDRDRVPNYGMF